MERSVAVKWRSWDGPPRVGRKVTSRPVDELIAFSNGYLSLGWPDKKLASALLPHLQDWLSGSATHEDASEKMTELVNTCPYLPKAQTLMRISKLSGSFGLFAVSQAADALVRDYPLNKVYGLRRSVEKKLRIALFQGNRIELRRLLTSYEKTYRSRIHDSESSRLLVDYCRAVLKAPTRAPNGLSRSPKEAEWFAMLSGRSILVIGPGSVSPAPNLGRFDFVVRIASSHTPEWLGDQDVGGGRADIIYVNPENLAKLRNHALPNSAHGTGSPWVCIKRGKVADDTPRTRRIDSGNLIFRWGHPNMVPLICTDLARIPGTRISVTGTSFFADPSPYRVDSRKFDHRGQISDRFGSSGLDYDRSTVISSHNPFNNLDIVRALVDTGRVTGDNLFREVCSLDSESYAGRLDAIYGKQRR